jgi:hypothetical protein
LLRLVRNDISQKIEANHRNALKSTGPTTDLATCFESAP